MKKDRLLELAGIGSNMSNPSHEPATDIPDNKIEPPANLQVGNPNPYQDSRDPEKEAGMMSRTIEKLIPQIKTAAMQGMSVDDIEQARDLFRQIMSLLSKKGEI